MREHVNDNWKELVHENWNIFNVNWQNILLENKECSTRIKYKDVFD